MEEISRGSATSWLFCRYSCSRPLRDATSTGSWVSWFESRYRMRSICGEGIRIGIKSWKGQSRSKEGGAGTLRNARHGNAHPFIARTQRMERIVAANAGRTFLYANRAANGVNS